MKILQTTLSTMIGFAFTLGGSGEAAAQEFRATTDGPVVIARETRSSTMGYNSLDQLRKKSLEVAAQAPTKKPTKGTKPTKSKPKSPKKYGGF